MIIMRSSDIRPVFALLLTACSGASDASGGSGAPTVVRGGAPAPADARSDHPHGGAPACDAASRVFPVAPILADRAHPCYAWVRATAPRVFAQTNDSAVLWSRRTAAKTGVLVSAMHSLGNGWFGVPGQAFKERLVDPSEEGVARLFAPAGDGTFASDASALWIVYGPPVPAKETRGKLESILPRHDFFVGAVDGQRFSSPGGIAPAPGPMQKRELRLDDGGATTTAPTFADAKPGDLLLLVGVPKTTGTASAAVGRVLDDGEVATAQRTLRDAGDEEGRVPHDRDAELWVEGEAMPGMSGGGAFDRQGHLVGILVRGSVAKGPNGLPYTRFVRMTFVVEQLRTALAKLPATKREAVTAVLGDLH